MKSMLQKDDDRNSEKFATIVITTHNCDEKNMTLVCLVLINEFYKTKGCLLQNRRFYYLNN